MGVLQQDSRQVGQDDVFIAVRGLHADGHLFIEDAISRGASVIICEESYYTEATGVCVIEVESTRNILGHLAQAFQGNPAEKLTIIGVTGTNGKTTISTLVWQALHELGANPSLLGTVAKHINKEVFDSRLTTADPIELAADMKAMANAGSTHLIMEVSSHALDQQRVNGFRFHVGAFTNLSHDHLDYHSDMEAYASAKRRLFDGLDENGWAVINIDDQYGAFMAKNAQCKVLDFSFHGMGTINCEILSSTSDGLKIKVDDVILETPLVGEFNAYNTVQALLICSALGYDTTLAAKILSECNGAPGRMERVQLAGDSNTPLVLVDYAHTPDALKNVAETLKGLKKEDENLIIIFGCGGDRDKAKRPAMAKIAEEYGDSVVVTSDNPRTEDPEAIIKDITAGFTSEGGWISITDRKTAIEKTILKSSSIDIILIAGKGHETYQEVNGIRSHFDDREIAQIALGMRAQRSAGVN
jgi:UDP-N-acetylmuramoyl-L-alanyl-D-glutamate--2,6-diaminopimelate ligase